MAESSQPGKAALAERAFEKLDMRSELDQLEATLSDLKMQYEQYFSGIIQFAPEKAHQGVKAVLRKLKKAPFKSSAMNYRLRSLEHRYQTFNNYWQRVLREKEDGTYSRDVFKANLREAAVQEELRAKTKQGKAERQMRDLFNSYKEALEKQTGKSSTVEFKQFQKHLIDSAKELKKRSGSKKVSFSVIVKGGTVKLKAKVSE